MASWRLRLGLCCAIAATSGVGCSSSSGDDATTDDGSADDADGGSAGDTPPAEMAGMLEAHNEARANVSPARAAGPMPALVWSGEVAAHAQAHADKCVWEHSSGSGYGENIYATTGQATPADVVGSWTDEEPNYDYASNGCSDVCGHYTQVVWANSLRLGCAVTDCTQNSPLGGGNWQFWVCNYDPPGNYSGEKPY